MKIIVIFFICIGFSGFSQVAYNTSAESARFFCENDSDVDLSVRGQTNCFPDLISPEQFSLFFYYRAASSHISMPDPNLFTIDAGTVDCAVNVWGPYASKTVADAEYSSDATLVDYAQTASTITVAHDLVAGKVYLMEVIVYDCSADFTLDTGQPTWFSNSWEAEADCIGCISGFNPQAGKYIVSGWVKDADADLGTVNYTAPALLVESTSATFTLKASGEIIDGWQRIEEEVIMILDDDFSIKLTCEDGGDCYFDDIRIFPKDGSMVTYVYDPITLRLMAELDERNYAKIYEYDEQGKLIRVKKETEMGIMTIQENRENNSKE